MKHFLLALLLTGCAAQQVESARVSMVGKPLAEVEGYLGIPKLDKFDDVTIAEWDYTEPPSSASIPLADLLIPLLSVPAALASGSLSFGSAGSCHAVATVKSGVVTAFTLSGANGGVSGKGAACEPVFRGFLAK